MRLLPALLLAATLISSAVAQDADSVNEALTGVFGEYEKFETAFTTLQAAVAAGDAEMVAALAAYPLVVKVDGRREIESAQAFVANYNEIVTDDIAAIVTQQDYDALIVTQDGIGFGNGQLWMSGVCEDDACAVWDVKIITIQRTDE